MNSRITINKLIMIILFLIDMMFSKNLMTATKIINDIFEEHKNLIDVSQKKLNTKNY